MHSPSPFAPRGSKWMHLLNHCKLLGKLLISNVCSVILTSAILFSSRYMDNSEVNGHRDTSVCETMSLVIYS